MPESGLNRLFDFVVYVLVQYSVDQEEIKREKQEFELPFSRTGPRSGSRSS